MNQDEKVSIILPAYKSEKTIGAAIESVLNQTYKNIELIVIENGKKDGTEQICKKFEKEHLNKIIYTYNEEPNVSNARNIGIEKATGTYLAFIDADDKYEINFLEKMVNCIKETNSQLVTCGYRTIYEKIERLIEESHKVEKTNNIKEYLEIVKESYLFNELWNKLYITSIVKENDIVFDPKFELGEDFIFNLDYLKWVQKASYINEPLYIYTDGHDGLKLKYRTNKFEIEYDLTKYLERFYKEKKYPLEYVYNRFARVYYNGITNIYHYNNPSTKEEKDKQLEVFIKQEKYQKDLNFFKDKITDKKFKIAVKYFFLRGKTMIKLFLFIKNRRKK